MCGISVIISQKNKAVAQELIQASTDIIHHRGPDGEGHYFGGNFAFGHRRLAIIDLSEDGVQPMHRHDLVITYNGEIFNYIELREELKSYGYSFETETDTEVILNAYRHWGFACQDHFTGMWAFALYDPSKNSIFCSRDRFCIKPFVYTQCGEYFLIGSEIKQFLHIDGFHSVLNKDVTFDFLEKGLLNHTNETFFEHVYSLNGGHQLVYNLSDHSYSISKWYQPDFSEHKISFEKAKIEYDKLLTQSIKLRLRSDVTVGVALSGGIDSSGIVCLTRELDTKGHYKAITSCYENKQYDESYYAECVATKTGVDLKKTFPNLNNLITKGSLDKMIWHQEQPIGSASHFSEFSVFKEAYDQDITVMLCGQGPDEHSAGYNSYFSIYQLSLLKRFKMKKLSSELGYAQGSKFGKSKRFAGFLFLNAFKQKKSDFINTNYFSKRSTKPRMGVFLEADTIRKLSIQEIFTTSIPYQAHSEDRNSMCFSIESRSPYLDHGLLEYAVKLPDDNKIRNNTNKYILREVLKPYLPKEVYERKDKMGFEAPDEIWFKENAELIRPRLAEAVETLHKALNGKTIMIYYDEYIQGNVPFSSIFLKILSLASLCKQYNFQL
jgi:asparagine synthase (glutamine-hydrolysing)